MNKSVSTIIAAVIYLFIQSLISNDTFILREMNLFKKSKHQRCEHVFILVSSYCSMHDKTLPL